MKIFEVLSALERFAPLPLQESYDNAGLQVGLPAREVSGVLLCLDVTEAVVEEAARRGCNLVVAHHPLLFRPLRRLAGEDLPQRCVALAVRLGVAVAAMHTNMDSAPGGVSFRMARKLGLDGARFLKEKPDGGGDGVIGRLPQPMTAADFLQHVKATFRAGCLQTNAPLERPISTVALCGGAGDFMLGDAIAAGADAFITGEMHYHQWFGHDGELQIAVCGHYESEQYTTEIFQEIIQQACPGLTCLTTACNTNPIIYL